MTVTLFHFASLLNRWSCVSQVKINAEVRNH